MDILQEQMFQRIQAQIHSITHETDGNGRKLQVSIQVDNTLLKSYEESKAIRSIVRPMPPITIMKEY